MMQPQAKECQQPPEVERGEERIFLLESPQRNQEADLSLVTLILSF